MPVLERHGAVAAAALAVAVLVAAVSTGARTAGGADASGYVTQAYLWLAGDLHLDRPHMADLPWPHAPETVAPLGYRPGGGTTIVPIYSPGVPMIMAAFVLAIGDCGPYLVSPVFAALGIGATFVLARRLTRRSDVGALAAFLLATSPVFLLHAMVPMSDVTTSALWTMSMCALTWRGPRAAGLGGVVAGLAIVARPNLAPLAIAGLAACGLWPDRQTARRFIERCALYLLCGVLPAMVVVAVLNRRLYGSPLTSGYGETRLLYSVGFFVENATSFSRHLLTVEGLALVPAGLALVLLGRRFATPRALPAASFCAIVFLSYLFYQPQGGWTFLRFLLPTFPLIFIAAALALLLAIARFGPPLRLLAFVLCLLVAVLRVGPYASRIWGVGAGEDRYAAVASYVERALPANAIVFAMQHSSTIAFYSGKPTLRYDAFTPARLQEALEWLRKRGDRPYLVLENWEEEEFRRRLGSDTALGRLDLRVLAEYEGGVNVRVYDPFEETPDPGRPFRLVAPHACRAPSPNWRPGPAR